jgi:hypothetical protein
MFMLELLVVLIALAIILLGIIVATYFVIVKFRLLISLYKLPEYSIDDRVYCVIANNIKSEKIVKIKVEWDSGKSRKVLYKTTGCDSWLPAIWIDKEYHVVANKLKNKQTIIKKW